MIFKSFFFLYYVHFWNTIGKETSLDTGRTLCENIPSKNHPWRTGSAGPRRCLLPPSPAGHPSICCLSCLGCGLCLRFSASLCLCRSLPLALESSALSCHICVCLPAFLFLGFPIISCLCLFWSFSLCLPLSVALYFLLCLSLSLCHCLSLSSTHPFLPFSLFLSLACSSGSLTCPCISHARDSVSVSIHLSPST